MPFKIKYQKSNNSNAIKTPKIKIISLKKN
jgi:hypothetical protein